MHRFLTIAIAVFCISSLSLTNSLAQTDSTMPRHVTDAVLNEWDPASFDIHEATGIRVAVENDTEKLYIALFLANKKLQRRLSLTGMSLIIDPKAKKRESTFIEFPIAKAPAIVAISMSNPVDENDITAFTNDLSNNMLVFKRKGFKEQASETEVFSVTDITDTQLSFGWDEKGVLYIEYEIPLSRLGGKESIKGKEISVGLKLNAQEAMSNEARPVSSTSSRIVSVPAGSGPPATGRVGNSRGGRGGGADFGAPAGGGGRTVTPPQTFWMKHHIQ